MRWFDSGDSLSDLLLLADSASLASRIEALVFWGPLIAAFDMIVATLAVAHVVLNKRDVRAAIGWCGIIILTPFLGTALYVLFGVNRLERKARKLRGKPASPAWSTTPGMSPFNSASLLGPLREQYAPLATLVDKVSERPLLTGNKVELLRCGDDAYDAMFEAIDGATQSISLCTYIFDRDRIGKLFVEKLSAAKERGVDVRVIIDGVGVRYSWPSIKGLLAAAGIQYAVFLPNMVPWKWHYSNLRCHRKILVIDGRIGFTGGLNIREGHSLRLSPRHPIMDTHFCVGGPVVEHLQEVFASDWEFCTGESLDGEKWFPDIEPAGDALARGISDGPDLEHDKMRLTLAGAIASARKSLLIVTPYFLPDASLIDALNVADLRGVDVNVVIPQKNNLMMVQWASTAQLWQILRRGVQVWKSPQPFDHSKLMVIDDSWCIFGSSNWDPRSLRLNFEFNVECYSAPFAKAMADLIRQKIKHSRPVTLADVDGRSLAIKLRDGIVRLFTPYL
jgi:cardiolipin synthase A/B